MPRRHRPISSHVRVFEHSRFVEQVVKNHEVGDALSKTKLFWCREAMRGA